MNVVSDVGSWRHRAFPDHRANASRAAPLPDPSSLFIQCDVQHEMPSFDQSLLMVKVRLKFDPPHALAGKKIHWVQKALASRRRGPLQGFSPCIPTHRHAGCNATPPVTAMAVSAGGVCSDAALPPAVPTRWGTKHQPLADGPRRSKKRCARRGWDSNPQSLPCSNAWKPESN